VQNVLRLKLLNRLEHSATFEVLVDHPAAAHVRVVEGELRLNPNEMETFHLQVHCPPDEFRNGQCPIQLRVRSDNGDVRSIRFKLIGPYVPWSPTEDEEDEDAHEKPTGGKP
jgi:hypothetical protein